MFRSAHSSQISDLTRRDSLGYALHVVPQDLFSMSNSSRRGVKQFVTLALEILVTLSYSAFYIAPDFHSGLGCEKHSDGSSEPKAGKQIIHSVFTCH
jgi:hypothetical protein